MAGFWNDLKHGCRVLLKAPGFALSAIIVLALGIGANTAIFGIVNGVLLRPLPYAEPDRLVQLWHTPPQKQFPGMNRFALSAANAPPTATLTTTDIAWLLSIRRSHQPRAAVSRASSIARVARW